MSVAEFRERARTWLAANAARIPKGRTAEDARAFQAMLFEGGFAGITWPTEYGGQGLTAAEARAWDEELQAYDVPNEQYGISLGMVGPILLDMGTHEQKEKWLPPLLRGETIGCQLFSEPSAGSDVAGLRTRAIRDGDEWVVDGQKVWTTHANVADFGILLARTNPDVAKHRGITMFVIDMHADGVEVRPLKDMTGASKFNEVFFDKLRLPADSVVGEVDQGWVATVQMLKRERLAITARIRRDDDPSSSAALVQAVKELGCSDDPIGRRALAEVYVSERVGDLFSGRLSEEVKAGIDPGARGSVGKLASGRHVRMLTSAVTTIFGSQATAWASGNPHGERLSLVVTGAPRYRIAGGTDEIQRNIIGERVLGLPKEPS